MSDKKDGLLYIVSDQPNQTFPFIVSEGGETPKVFADYGECQRYLAKSGDVHKGYYVTCIKMISDGIHVEFQIGFQRPYFTLEIHRRGGTKVVWTMHVTQVVFGDEQMEIAAAIERAKKGLLPDAAKIWAGVNSPPVSDPDVTGLTDAAGNKIRLGDLLANKVGVVLEVTRRADGVFAVKYFKEPWSECFLSLTLGDVLAYCQWFLVGHVDSLEEYVNLRVEMVKNGQ